MRSPEMSSRAHAVRSNVGPFPNAILAAPGTFPIVIGNAGEYHQFGWQHSNQSILQKDRKRVKAYLPVSVRVYTGEFVGGLKGESPKRRRLVFGRGTTGGGWNDEARSVFCSRHVLARADDRA